MNKTDLVKGVSKKSALSQKQSLGAINAILELIAESLRSGDAVALSGFGRFEIRNRRSRTAYSPLNGQLLTLPATRVPVFKVGKSLKKKVLA